MPPAKEYLWTLIVQLPAVVTTDNADRMVQEETIFTGTESDMHDTLDQLKNYGLIVDQEDGRQTYYPNIIKVDIIRDDIPQL